MHDKYSSVIAYEHPDSPLIVGLDRKSSIASGFKGSAIAACFSRGDDDARQSFWMTSPSKLPEARKLDGFGQPTLISDAEWDSFVERFRSATFATKLELVLLLLKYDVPITGAKIAQSILEQGNHYRSTLADLVHNRDMSDFAALVLVHREEKGQKIEIPRWIPHTHITRTWFAFENFDDAMSVKFTFPSSLLFEI